VQIYLHLALHPYPRNNHRRGSATFLRLSIAYLLLARVARSMRNHPKTVPHFRRLALRGSIYLGRMSPHGSSEVFCQASLAIVRLVPYTSCYRQGLPSCPCCHGHWWALTPPFHLFRLSGSLLSVALALRLLWPPVRWSLVSLVARTFLYR